MDASLGKKFRIMLYNSSGAYVEFSNIRGYENIHRHNIVKYDEDSYDQYEMNFNFISTDDIEDVVNMLDPVMDDVKRVVVYVSLYDESTKEMQDKLFIDKEFNGSVYKIIESDPSSDLLHRYWLNIVRKIYKE